MKEHVEQAFLALFDVDSGALYENLSFERCVFTNCNLAMTKRLEKRSTVRNVRLVDCRMQGGTIGPAILEDVLVDGLSAGDLVRVWSPFFRRVTLRNRMGSLKINKAPHFVDRDPQLLRTFDDARAEFYASVDWALDISEAKFTLFEASGVPARLIRRDPATQAVVLGEKAADRTWRKKVARWNKYWPMFITASLDYGDPDVVLVAPKAAPKKRFQELVDGIQNLRDLGVAEPD